MPNYLCEKRKENNCTLFTQLHQNIIIIYEIKDCFIFTITSSRTYNEL